MKRWLWIATILAGACCAREAGAQRVRDLPPLNDPTQFPRVEAVIDSTYRGRMRVVDVQFFEGFSPGGSRDIAPADVDRAANIIGNADRRHDIVFIGATDPMRFHETRRKLTNLHNYTLGLARANFLNQMTGSRGVVSTSVIMNDRRGVYVVTVEPRTGSDLAEHTHPYAALDHGHEFDAHEVKFSPHVAATWVRVDDEDYFTPQVGLAARKGRYSLFMDYGRTFRDNEEVDGLVETGDDRVMISGLRIGQEQGLFFQLAFVDARELIPYLDMYTSRAVGGTVGLGFGWHPEPVDVMLHGGIGLFDSVTPEQLDDEVEFGFHLGLGVGFTF